jgi:hypothetical protein
MPVGRPSFIPVGRFSLYTVQTVHNDSFRLVSAGADSCPYRACSLGEAVFTDCSLFTVGSTRSRQHTSISNRTKERRNTPLRGNNLDTHRAALPNRRLFSRLTQRSAPNWAPSVTLIRRTVNERPGSEGSNGHYLSSVRGRFNAGCVPPRSATTLSCGSTMRSICVASASKARSISCSNLC